MCILCICGMAGKCCDGPALPFMTLPVGLSDATDHPHVFCGLQDDAAYQAPAEVKSIYEQLYVGLLSNLVSWQQKSPSSASEVGPIFAAT